VSRAAPIVPGCLAVVWSLALCCAGPVAMADESGNVMSFPPRPAGCDPAAVRERLAEVGSAEISRACGNISMPWAYRGPSGRDMAMQTSGKRSGGREWSRGFAAQLLAAGPVDTASKFHSTRLACDSSTAPVYFVKLRERKRETSVLLRFDVGEALLFDAGEPLGMIRMAGRADSLWAALADRLDDDPLLRGSRPAPLQSRADSAKEIYVEKMPEVIHRVAPRYPESARQHGIEGIVWLLALVGKDGAVHDAVVVDGPNELRDAALAAAWQWTFKPATASHAPVSVWVGAPVKFTLR